MKQEVIRQTPVRRHKGLTVNKLNIVDIWEK